MNKLLASLTLGLIAVTNAGCKTTPPKISIEGLDTVVSQSVTGVLEDIRRDDRAETIWVAWAGVDNKSATPLNSALEDTNRAVSELFVNARDKEHLKMFHMISEQQSKAAMQAAGVTQPNQLTLREPREKFVSVLTAEGRAPQYMMFGTFTNADSGDKHVEERRFRLSLQVMHATSGEIRAERSGVFTRQAE